MVQTKYERWLSRVTDDATRQQLKQMSKAEIEDSFYRDLEFGTGGLRGVMGAGTNRMNISTVRQATQGLANELKNHGAAFCGRGVVIAYDSRNHSAEFAMECVKVLSANGILAYLFDSLRPTPMLSFAVRHLNCARGIVITASHNPKEYNGYKVYGEDGGQIPPDTASVILDSIEKTDIFDGVKVDENPNYRSIGKEVDDAYIRAVKQQSLGITIPDDLKIIYTPLHGSGNLPVRRILNEIGAKNVFVVPEQELPNGDFPTVKSPNPENIEAFDIAIDYAKKMHADLVFGTDPDSDRIGVAVRKSDGSYFVLTGNQTGTLLCEFILRNMQKKEPLSKNDVVIKTIVTSEMLRAVTDRYGVTLCDVLTGFKFIGEKIKEFEENGNRQRFVFGLEESYGYLKGTYARDKDAVVASMLVCEMAADYFKQGMTLYDGLVSLYQTYGCYLEKLKTVTLTGNEGAAAIQTMMDDFRSHPPKEIAGSSVLRVLDYQTGIDGLPKSNVLKYVFENGWFAVRPSGTEPKIKFYFGVRADDEDAAKSALCRIEQYLDNLLA